MTTNNTNLTRANKLTVKTLDNGHLQADLFRTDLRKADVVTLYLLESLNEKLRPKLLRELKPGARISR